MGFLHPEYKRRLLKRRMAHANGHPRPNTKRRARKWASRSIQEGGSSFGHGRVSRFLDIRVSKEIYMIWGLAVK